MQKYLILILVIGLLVLVFTLIIKGLSTSGDSVKTSENDEGAINTTETDFSISDYFEEEFKEQRSATSVEGEDGDFDTCELLGETVREGTVIFDSTCASNGQDEN